MKQRVFAGRTFLLDIGNHPGMMIFLIIVPVLLSTGCAGIQKKDAETKVYLTNTQHVEVSRVRSVGPELQEQSAEQSYVLQVGDILDVKLYYHPELNETVTIRPDGMISLQLIDEVRAAGLTPSELDHTITKRYVPFLEDPNTTVIVKEFSNQKVYVGGEVNKPGLIPLTGNLHTIQAILQAGGKKDTAQMKNVIIVRYIGDTNAAAFSVDMTKVLKGEPDILLSPYDIVFVPKKKIAKVNLFVEQYISNMIPKSVLFNLPYNLRPGSVF